MNSVRHSAAPTTVALATQVVAARGVEWRPPVAASFATYAGSRCPDVPFDLDRIAVCRDLG